MLRHRRHLPAQRGLRVEKIVPWLLGLLACCKMRFGAKVGTSQRASVRWAMRDELEDSISNRCCLRKLEMRIARCWRNDDSLRESDHSSLQVSSTQSPSTEGHEQANRPTPLDSFSSLSSPLDHSSVLKD